MTKLDAIDKLRELADRIYEALDEMRDILKEVAPEELQRAESYWMAHIDGALENRRGWLGRSFVNFEDTISYLEGEEYER